MSSSSPTPPGEAWKKSLTSRTRTIFKGFVWVVITGIVCIGLAFILKVVVQNAIDNELRDAPIIHNPDSDETSEDQEDRFDDWKELKPGQEDDKGLVRLYMYLYNLTNPGPALRDGATPMYTEVGPFAYRAYYEHFGVEFSNKDREVSYFTKSYFRFDEAASGPGLTENTPITNVWATWQEVIRQTRTVDRADLENFLIGYFHKALWEEEYLDVIREDQAELLPQCQGTKELEYSDRCWDLVYEEWGRGNGSFFGVKPTARNNVGIFTKVSFHYFCANGGSCAISSYDYDRAKWLLNGPYGFFKEDVDGIIDRDVNWGTLFWRQYSVDKPWVMSTWQMTEPEADSMYQFFTSVRDKNMASLLSEIIFDGGAQAFDGWIATRRAKDWLFNFEDPFAKKLGEQKNGAYFFNHVEKYGNSIFAANDTGRTWVHTGKDKFSKVRNLLGWRGEYGELPSRRQIPLEDGTSFWCEFAAPFQGKDPGGVFLDDVKKSDTFKVFDFDTLRPVLYKYSKKSKIHDVDTWRFTLDMDLFNHSAPAATTYQNTSRYGPSAIEGMFNMSCPVENVRVFTSQPRFFLADVPPDLMVAGVPEGNFDDHFSFYDIEPYSGYSFGGAERFQASIFGTFNSTKYWMFPLVWVSAEGKLSKDLADAFLDALALPDALFGGFLVLAIVLIFIGAIGMCYIATIQRHREKSRALAEWEEKQRRKATEAESGEQKYDELNTGPIYVYLFLHMMAFSLIIPVLPDVVLDLFDGNYPKASLFLSWINAGPALMQFFSNPLMGTMSDLLGRKPFVILSVSGLCFQMFLIGINVSITSLIIASVVRGATDAAFTMAFTSLVDWSRPKDIAKKFGMVGATIGIAFVLGPLIGAGLGTVDSIHLPFLFAGGICAVNILYVIFMVPETSRRVREVSKEERLKEFSWAPANPFYNLRILNTSSYMRWMTTAFFMNVMGATVVAIWFLFTKLRFGWAITENGLFLFTFGLTVIVVQGGLLRWLHPKWGDRKALDRTFPLHAATFVLFGLATEGWMLYVVLFVGCLGFMANPIIRALLAREVSDIHQGMLQGALSGVGTLANAIGPLLMGAIFAYFVGDGPYVPGAPFYFAALLNGLGYFAVRYLYDRFPTKFKLNLSDMPEYEKTGGMETEMDTLSGTKLVSQGTSSKVHSESD